MSRFEIDPHTGQFRPKPEPSPEYLEHYSQEAIKAMGEERAEELFEGIDKLDPELKISLDEPNETLEYGLADRHYEEFSHIESWDDVVSCAADLRVDLDNYKFRMGDLVNFACPKRKTGRPKDDDDKWNISSLAGSIGEDRSTLSQLANNAEFWHPGIREEIPPQVSWRQLARSRVDSGWRPGKPVTNDYLTKALRLVLQMADGIYADKKKADLTPLHYARRIKRAAEKALVSEVCTPQSATDLFLTIFESAEEIIEIIPPEEGEDGSNQENEQQG